MIKLFETKIDRDTVPTTKESRMVGAYVSQPLADYLAIFCLRSEVARSDIFRKLVTQWYEKTISTYSEEQLLADIASQIQRAWDLEKTLEKMRPTDAKDRFKAVLDEVSFLLSQRGVSTDHILKIQNLIHL